MKDGNSFYLEITRNRTILMGIAMLMVLVFHFFCWVYNPIGRLNMGYIGVDIFLFLSGLGLSCSYEKNSIAKFYFNRFRRIYPIYFIAVLVTYFLYNLNWSISDLFANLIFVGYYTKSGVNRYDWFLEALFSLYIFFPLFYYFGKLRYYGLITILFITAIVLSVFSLEWYYNCLIGRIPIFYYGVIFKDCCKSYRIVSLIGIIMYIPCGLYINGFFAGSLLALPLIIVFLALIKYFNSTINKLILYIGNHTLEIYIANLFIYWIVEVYNLSMIERCLAFLIIQLLASYLFIVINRCCQRKTFGLSSYRNG